MPVAGLPDHDHACFLGPGAPHDDARVVAAVHDAAARGFKAVLVTAEGGEAGRRADRWHALLWGALAERDVECIRAADGYPVGSAFDPAAQIAMWEQRVEHALAEGRTGVLAVADMAWTERHRVPMDVLLEYEALVNDLHARLPLTGICDYSSSRQDGRRMRQLLGVHPAVRGGRPTVLRRPHLSVTRSGDAELVLVGEIDLTTAPALAEALLPTLAWDRDVTLRVERLTFADVPGLRTLARVGTELQGRGRRLVLRGAPPHLCNAISLGRWGDVLEVAA